MNITAATFWFRVELRALEVVNSVHIGRTNHLVGVVSDWLRMAMTTPGHPLALPLPTRHDNLQISDNQKLAPP